MHGTIPPPTAHPDVRSHPNTQAISRRDTPPFNSKTPTPRPKLDAALLHPSPSHAGNNRCAGWFDPASPVVVSPAAPPSLLLERLGVRRPPGPPGQQPVVHAPAVLGLLLPGVLLRLRDRPGALVCGCCAGESEGEGEGEGEGKGGKGEGGGDDVLPLLTYIVKGVGECLSAWKLVHILLYLHKFVYSSLVS